MIAIKVKVHKFLQVAPLLKILLGSYSISGQNVMLVRESQGLYLVFAQNCLTITNQYNAFRLLSKIVLS